MCHFPDSPSGLLQTGIISFHFICPMLPPYVGHRHLQGARCSLHLPDSQMHICPMLNCKGGWSMKNGHRHLQGGRISLHFFDAPSGLLQSGIGNLKAGIWKTDIGKCKGPDAQLQGSQVQGRQVQGGKTCKSNIITYCLV